MDPKWRLSDSTGPVADPDSVVSVASRTIACETGLAEAEGEQTMANGGGLQYLGNGEWHYNWVTLHSWAGTCRRLELTLSDGSVHTALFRLR